MWPLAQIVVGSRSIAANAGTVVERAIALKLGGLAVADRAADRAIEPRAFLRHAAQDRRGILEHREQQRILGRVRRGQQEVDEVLRGLGPFGLGQPMQHVGHARASLHAGWIEEVAFEIGRRQAQRDRTLAGHGGGSEGSHARGDGVACGMAIEAVASRDRHLAAGKIVRHRLDGAAAFRSSWIAAP